MKFETFLLHGLFVASLLVSGLILGAMLTATPQAVQLAGAAKGTSLGLLLAAPGGCMLPPDGVVCPRHAG